jgi:methylisocitrate lyase
MTDPTDRHATFRRLHESGCFVMPNPWDLGSARLLAGLGFPALATTSSGFAWSLGRPDNHVSLDEALAHLRSIAGGVELPVNADFEGGFAVEPAEVGANVALATGTGVAGLSIEDSTGDASHPLFDFGLAVERVRAARAAIDASGTGVLLTGRSEGFIVGRPDLAETIRRLTAYAEAGADCLYAPGIRSRADIAAVVAAVAPKPVNVLVGSDVTTVAELAELGVRRISVGGALARAAWDGFLRAAREIAERGTFASLAQAVPFADIDGAFDARPLAEQIRAGRARA